MAEQVIDDEKYTRVRLPETYIPTTYDLHLKPDLNKFSFEGTVKIEYVSEKNTLSKEIVLNAIELQINSGYVQGLASDSQQIKLNRVTYSPKNEVATLEFDGLAPSSGQLTLNFTGNLNDKISGFYRSSFTLDDTVVHLAATQFAAIHARRSFPCWDEPSFKAVFTLHMTYYSKLITKSSEYKVIAISCSPEISCFETETSGWVRSSFAPTPKMSTYLLAYIVGPLEAIEASENGRSIRLLTTPGKKELGRYALDVACKSIRFYEEYFKIPYPLPKLDHAIVPDMPYGAMENWGLITYRESVLLFDPKNTPAIRKQYIGQVVCHEVAHQWFGNLVTMRWWTDLWLNEGFASFMQNLCLDHIEPEFNIWSQFVVTQFSRALELDSLRNSHPIEVPINRPEEVEEIFDYISYNKGASVIRMVYEFIGRDQFCQGMKEYLSKYAYKNASTIDLWHSLESTCGLSISRMMSSWTSQTGYPSLTVSSSKVGDDIKLSISQSKFLLDGQISDEESNVTWSVPITISTGADPNKIILRHLMESKNDEITVKGVCNSWVKVNTGHIGFYRVNYSSELRDKLCDAVRNGSLPEIDRLGLQLDFFAFCLAGQMRTVDLLKFISEFKRETSYPVWRSVDVSVGRLMIIFKNTEFEVNLNRFAIDLYSEAFKQVGWDKRSTDDHATTLMRTMMSDSLVSFGHQESIAKSFELFKSYRETGALIQPDVKAAVYSAIAAYGNDQEFESLFELYRKSDSNEERGRICRCISQARSIERLERVIKFIFSDEVKVQDKTIAFMALGVSNPSVGWTVFRNHKDRIVSLCSVGALISSIVKSLTENLASIEMLDEIKTYFAENKIQGCERAIHQAIEAVQVNTSLLIRDREEVKAFSSSY